MKHLSPETKQRISTLLTGARVALQWGFVPTVLYLGFKRGADEGAPALTFLRGPLGTVKIHISLPQWEDYKYYPFSITSPDRQLYSIFRGGSLSSSCGSKETLTALVPMFERKEDAA